MEVEVGRELPAAGAGASAVHDFSFKSVVRLSEL